MPAGSAMAARARSAPAALAAGDQATASVLFAYRGEAGDKSAGTHLSTSRAGDRTAGLVHRTEYFKARVTVFAPILVQWHLHTS